VKTGLKGKRFQDVEDTEKNMAELNPVHLEAFADFSKKFKRCNKCIQVVLVAHGVCLSIHIIFGILERSQP
jgi:hypothetical protein